MKVGIYSHCTIDTIMSGDTKYEAAGGPACYCSLTARNQKFDVNLYTKYGQDFPLIDFLQNNKIDEKDAKVLKQKEKQKQNYLKYGTIYGKKFAVKTDYGKWDKDFTINELEQFIKMFYKKLKKGGTCIIFFDLWKITNLKNLLDKYGFKQIRFIEWIKTNPQPLNSTRNYLTNCREIALTAVKGGKPTFNSKYDKGIYEFPLQGGKNRFHPTQKSLKLFEALIEKHSNKGDLIVDTFLGGGTTAIASKNTGRKFKGCEISKEYFDKVVKIIF